jgi:hypothetical protein
VQFTKEQMKEIESKVNKLISGVCDLTDYISEDCNIPRNEVKNITFLNWLNTVLSGQIEYLKEYMSNDTFEKFKERCDIIDFVDSPVFILLKDENGMGLPKGSVIQVPGKVCFELGRIGPIETGFSDEMIQRMFVKDRVGNEIDICLECFEGFVSGKVCSYCDCEQ